MMPEKPEIFLSYASEDRGHADQVFEMLVELGYAPWMDEHSIQVSREWSPLIVEAISTCDIFLVLLSRNTTDPGRFFNLEIDIALKRQRSQHDWKGLIPVRLEDCKVPARLEGLQCVNFFRHGWPRLVKEIKAQMGSSESRDLAKAKGLLAKETEKRAAEQLDPATKRYKSMEKVEEACKRLADDIRTGERQKGSLELIVGWKDDDGAHIGSSNVAELLAREFGVEYECVHMTERGGERQVVDDLRWAMGIQKTLIVDDACYSGKTLMEIDRGLKDANPKLSVVFAVISKDKSINWGDKLYFADQHDVRYLLFPWGWSRLIRRFHDVLALPGISERRFAERLKHRWGTAQTVSYEMVENVSLLTIHDKQELLRRPNDMMDALLYFLEGDSEVSIGDRTGICNPDEYVFIPRGVRYRVKASGRVVILELFSKGR